MAPNQETIRLAAKVLTDRQFEVWRLLQSDWSEHRIAIATGLSRRTIRDHKDAANQKLNNAILENGDQWPATQPGFDTSTPNETTPTSPKPSAPAPSDQQPPTPPAATPGPLGESQPSAQQSQELFPAPPQGKTRNRPTDVPKMPPRA